MHTPKSSYLRSSKWGKPHIREHDEQGVNENRLAGLVREESDAYETFHRIEPESFDYKNKNIS